MSTIYPRGNKLWIGITDASGKRRMISSGFRVGEEAKARKLLETLDGRASTPAPTLSSSSAPLLRDYLASWTAKRDAAGLAGDTATRVRLHVLPALGELPLNEIKPRHVRDLLQTLKAKIGSGKEQLAPKTVRNVFGALHRLFEDARVDELIDANPAVYRRGELPAKADKDPLWRARALFTRDEVEQLLSSQDIPEERRAVYALGYLAGLRIGEIAALRWRAIDSVAEPLGRMTIGVSYNRKKDREKGTKTGAVRDVPIHPTLAAVLAAWKLSGWAQRWGRAPGADDLVVPGANGSNLKDNAFLELFHADLEAHGLRRRRFHDARRTLISLALADGASKDILRWATHTGKGDIVDQYTTLPWATLCEHVGKLKIGLREGKLLRLAASAEPALRLPERPAPATVSATVAPKSGLSGLIPETSEVPRARFEDDPQATGKRSGKQQAQESGVSDGAPRIEVQQGAPTVAAVAGREALALALDDAADRWRGGEQPRELRRRLFEVLRQLDESGA